MLYIRYDSGSQNTYISSPAYLIDFNKRQKKVGTKYIEAARQVSVDSFNV
jgi:hypothetical protein